MSADILNKTVLLKHISFFKATVLFLSMMNRKERQSSHIQQLADHIKRNLRKGYTLDAMRYSLIGQGYSRMSVDQAINLANEQLSMQAPPLREKPQIIHKILDDGTEKIMQPQKSFWQKVKD